MDIVRTINRHGKITISLGTGNVATLKGDFDEIGSDTAGIVCATDSLSSDGDNNHEDEIRIGLEKKLDAMVLRELYGKSKIAPTEGEWEKARQEYLDRRGISDCFLW